MRTAEMDESGLPGVDSSWAFAAVCAILFVLAGLEVWLLRHLKWI